MSAHRKVGVLVVLVTLLVEWSAAEARIKLKLLEGNDLFYFHAQKFDPDFRSFTGTLRFEVSNAGGLIYAVEIPPGACVGSPTGRSCVFRDKAARTAKSGLAYFKVLYEAQSHGNKMYLQSYGDLSAATDPVMSFRIYQDGELWAALNNVAFKATRTGWVGLF
jgi:hypothetical protein